MFYNNSKIISMNPDQLNEKIRNGDDFFLLDVRTANEHTSSSIPGSFLIPLAELRHRLLELPRDREIVVYCRVGHRSAYACIFLSQQGYTAINLEGGIQQWNTAGNVSLTKAS